MVRARSRCGRRRIGEYLCAKRVGPHRCSKLRVMGRREPVQPRVAEQAETSRPANSRDSSGTCRWSEQAQPIAHAAEADNEDSFSCQRRTGGSALILETAVNSETRSCSGRTKIQYSFSVWCVFAHATAG